jgi:polyisoprenoid-binding protein YceI
MTEKQRRAEVRRIWFFAAIAATFALAWAVIQMAPGGVVAQEKAAAIATPSGELGKADPVDAPDGSITYALVSDKSSAGYTVKEELASIGDTEAVGTTNAIIGELVLSPDGEPIAGSRVDIDLRTLTSDETRRDNYLRGNSLESDAYPIATFILTRVEDWDGPLEEGETSEFKLVGNLTVHGVTKEVAWDATGTLEDDAIVGTATTSLGMGDFDIETPRVPMVLGVDETITLDLEITAEAAS